MKGGYYKLLGFILLATLTALALSCGFDGRISKTVEDTLNPPETDEYPKVLLVDTEMTVHVHSTVKLDGSYSYDPQQGKITFAWTLHRPNGSAAELSDATTPVTTFVADKGGYYTASLQVTNEADKVSPFATAYINVVGASGNHPPVAIAGADQTVTITTKSVAALNGTASHDADGDELFYQWFLLGAPAGARLDFLQTSTPTPQLYPRTAGIYTVRLEVSDGVDTDIDYIEITAQ